MASDLIVRDVPTIADHQPRAAFKGSTSTTRRLVRIDAPSQCHGKHYGASVTPTNASSVTSAPKVIAAASTNREQVGRDVVVTHSNRRYHPVIPNTVLASR